MSRPENATESTDSLPLGAMRLLPSVVFGMRAAALARVALPVGLFAASVIAGAPMAGAESQVILGTTCCPPPV